MIPNRINIPTIGGVNIQIKDYLILDHSLSTKIEYSSRLSFLEEIIRSYQGKRKELVKTLTHQVIRIDYVKIRCSEGMTLIQVIFDITEKDNHFPCDDI